MRPKTYRLGRALFALSTAALLLAALPAFAQNRRNRGDWQQPDRVIADLNLEEGMAVADVGCGWGYFTFPMAGEVGPEGKVFALDINEEAIAGLRKRRFKRHFGGYTRGAIRSEAVECDCPSRVRSHLNTNNHSAKLPGPSRMHLMLVSQ